MSKLEAFVIDRRVMGIAIILFFSGCFSAPYDAPIAKPSNEIEPTAAKKPREPNAVVEISFADLDLPIEPESTFQDWMLTQRVHDLTGKTVRIRGFIGNGLFQLKNIKEFVLMRDLDCCQFGPGGTADHLIQVKLLQNLSTSFTIEPVIVQGNLTLEPFTGSDGKTWSIYRLDAVKIELDPAK